MYFFYSHTSNLSIFNYKIVHHFFERNLRNAWIYFVSINRDLLSSISKYINVLPHFWIFFQLIKEFIIFAVKLILLYRQFAVHKTFVYCFVYRFSTYLFSVLILATSSVICFNFHTRALRRAALL